ncbi:MAG: hypothetical protein QNJ38_19760 [Prochloraceae cyanobacterium]|nr:hypothetical protein [Prochloraceae cyanobacterium]
MKNIYLRVLRIGILTSMLAGTVACTDLFNFYRDRNIAQILQIKVEQGKNLDRQVSVDGTVTRSISFLESGAYQLQDETGTIWIFTDDELPEAGTALEIKGKLRHKNISIEDRDLGQSYIFETERIYKITGEVKGAEVIGVPISQPNK